MYYHVMLNDNVNNELESPKQSKSQALATEFIGQPNPYIFNCAYLVLLIKSTDLA